MIGKRKNQRILEIRKCTKTFCSPPESGARETITGSRILYTNFSWNLKKEKLIEIFKRGRHTALHCGATGTKDWNRRNNSQTNL